MAILLVGVNGGGGWGSAPSFLGHALFGICGTAVREQSTSRGKIKLLKNLTIHIAMLGMR